MRLAVRQTLSFLSVLLAGLLAGLQWGTGIAQYTALSLSGPVWLLRHQAEDALFREIMPGYMWVLSLSLAGAAFLTHGRARVLFVLAATFSLLQMVITISHEVPINRLVAHWTAARFPTIGTTRTTYGWSATGNALACPLLRLASRSPGW